MHTGTARFLALIRHPLKYRWFLLTRLPAAFFSGVRIRTVDNEHCAVSVPYKWFTRNPFRSTYFACLAMAAEMSTGVLAMAQCYGRRPAVSMLVTGLEAAYTRKAKGISIFTCSDGELICQAIEEAIATGESRTVRAESVGRNAAGEELARFHITWSFRQKETTIVSPN
jgi:hypothetical protein